jgi:hypothetical protein
MNLVLEDAEEVNTKTKSRKRLGRLVCCFCLPRAALTRLLFFFFQAASCSKGTTSPCYRASLRPLPEHTQHEVRFAAHPRHRFSRKEGLSKQLLRRIVLPVGKVACWQTHEHWQGGILCLSSLTRQQSRLLTAASSLPASLPSDPLCVCVCVCVCVCA